MSMVKQIPINREMVLKLKAQNLTIKKIAMRLGCSETIVRRIINKHG